MCGLLHEPQDDDAPGGFLLEDHREHDGQQNGAQNMTHAPENRNAEKRVVPLGPGALHEFPHPVYDAQLQQQVENHGGQHHEHESRPAVERIAGGRSQAQPFEQGVRPTFQKCLHTRTRINFRASTAAAAEKPENGEIDNLQRGGSDYTASLIGAAVNASEIQIWTDIDGMHDNDPRIVDKTSPVRHLHFEEAAELAYFGAKILHPTCVQPAKYANIPVRLLNTMEPTAPGTLISNDTEKGKIKAVAAKDNITAIKIKSSRMLLAHGFLRKVFEIFESYQTSIDMICTSEVGVSVSIDNTKHLNEILDDLKKYGTVTVDQDMCIICVVGDLEWENVGFEAKALDAMRDIPVRMISFGGSNYNISFLIREEDKKKALQSLSDHLFNNK